MATSSIFAQIKVENKEDVEAFANTLLKSEKATKDERLMPTCRFVTDPDEIKAVVSANRSARKGREYGQSHS